MSTTEAVLWGVVTPAVEERLGKEIYLKHGKKYFVNRPVIGHNTLVDDHVYLGNLGEENLVVDSKKSPEIRELYEDAKFRATENISIKEKGIEKRTLQAVYDTVAERIFMQDVSDVETLVRECNASEYDKISLGTFLKAGVGVSRHCALACAVVLELSKKDGIIEGTPSVNRNTVGNDTNVWCEYKNPKGKIFILDVRRGFLGELKRAPEKIRRFYERPPSEDF